MLDFGRRCGWGAIERGIDIGAHFVGCGRKLVQPVKRHAIDQVHKSPLAGGPGLLGFLEGESAIDWERVIFSGLTIKGIYGRQMYETWYKMTAMLQSGLDVSPVITHRFPYTEYETAFEVMISGRSGKIILEWATE